MPSARRPTDARPWAKNFALALLALVVLPAVSHSQELAAKPAMARPDPVFAIRGFDIAGDNPLPSAHTSAILAPFLRTQATIETLQKATAALESALREQGYGLHRVALPPQELGASVTLNVVKFVIGQVSVQGASHFSEANIRASLPELQVGSAPNFKRLAVQAAIANESQSKQVQVTLKESDEADKIKVQIQVRDSRPWNFSVGLSNAGSSATGRDRLVLAGTHSNVLDHDHQLTGAYTTSLAQPGNVKQWGLDYRIPLYERGGILSLNHTRSDVVGNFGAFSSSGAGQTLGLSYRHFFAPAGAYRSYLLLGVDDKQFDSSKINGIALPGQTLRRARPFSLGYDAKMESDTALWSYHAELAINLPGGAGNSLADYQSEDPRISASHWKLLRGGVNYTANLAAGWQGSARGQFQYSPDALISGEQFGLGGASSVRGTQERPLSGDTGLSLTLEFTSPQVLPGLRFLGFLDGGWLSNVVGNGSTKPATDRLSSVGLGLRYGVGKMSLAADWARVLTGSVVPLSVNASVPQAGQQKLHVNIAGRF